MAFALKSTSDTRSSALPRRYRLAQQRWQLLQLQSGDTLYCAGDDALQQLEVIRLDQPQAPALAAEAASTGLAAGTLAMLEQADSVAQALQQKLATLELPAGCLEQALTLAAAALNSGVELVAQAAQTLLIVAPARPLYLFEADHYLAPAEVTLSHHSEAFADDLPDAMAAVAQSIRIPDSSARAYTVKAGEYIQIIDVEGKQCSDFIAFDLADIEALRRGEIAAAEVATLDAAATRTMMGHALPKPGLHSRFYDQNLRSMLEVVQDTVGRHDSFLLACTPKYYEDAGYFGHISCTANFNNALQEWGIPPRAGWPAINFFFNTSVCDEGSVTGDEPWSRPGDYVLLKASRDLLCLSSACPDEIDSANGWCPTDIHVRVYGAENLFPRALAWRNAPEELPRMTLQTGFHRRVSALTQHLSEYRGYWVADEYNGYGATAEYLACRERVAMIDLTPLRKFEVMGPDAEQLLQLALTRNVRRLAIGEISYTALCHVTGGMIDDGTIFRLGPQTFRLITGDSWVCNWLKQLAAEHNFKVRVQESTSQIHNIAVQGPNSRELLSQLIWTAEHQVPVTELAWFHFTLGRLGGPDGRPVMVSRTGYTGELGFEVWCHPDDAEQLWDAVWDAGQAFDIAPMGFKALDMLRIEAGLIFANYEFCPQTNPYEAGIGFTVPMKTKEDDFIGREAMARQNPESRHKLMGLFINSTEPVAHGDEVFFPLAKGGRFPVGVVTSAIFSPLLKRQIAMVRLAPEAAAVGTELEVGQLDGLQKRIGASVTTLPFYDPERTRVRS
ncbi:DUF1989 domain-containing protein [Oceanobacter mangrovi]|uniref:DUF1989 domain-containing protein n=1 Tax=Oceanobacter mangrovi TaxID=2862510 RepID=UPI001C8D85C2|nr:DUF1989 domain-containing protein [Oceanobacter mangrovi]